MALPSLSEIKLVSSSQANRQFSKTRRRRSIQRFCVSFAAGFSPPLPSVSLSSLRPHLVSKKSRHRQHSACFSEAAGKLLMTFK